MFKIIGTQSRVKSCPHCGSKLPALVSLKKSRYVGPYIVACFRCGELGPLCTSKDDAINDWNNFQGAAR